MTCTILELLLRVWNPAWLCKLIACLGTLLREWFLSWINVKNIFHPGKRNFFNYVQNTRKVRYGQISFRYFSLECNHTLQPTGAGTGGLYFFLSYPCISFYTSCILLQSYRYCQPPAKLWEWMEPYLEDEEVSYW